MWASPQPDFFTHQRHLMVETQIRRRGIRNQRILNAMSRVPRHRFASPEYWSQAYNDHPIPIGEGQTISQPYIVAITLDALSLTSSDVVLEIGTGSGYQTALLAELCKYVYSVELHESLAEKAKNALTELGYSNVTVIVGDGTQGFPQHAPYDAIVVAAAAADLPQPLMDQLNEGGRLVIPIGIPEIQQLQLIQKQNGVPVITVLEGCRFVPLIGAQR
jgi:protein-L-isoaspartate(D-aspartate) O-methyltransferase